MLVEIVFWLVSWDGILILFMVTACGESIGLCGESKGSGMCQDTCEINILNHKKVCK